MTARRARVPIRRIGTANAGWRAVMHLKLVSTARRCPRLCAGVLFRSRPRDPAVGTTGLASRRTRGSEVDEGRAGCCRHPSYEWTGSPQPGAGHVRPPRTSRPRSSELRCEATTARHRIERRETRAAHCLTARAQPLHDLDRTLATRRLPGCVLLCTTASGHQGGVRRIPRRDRPS